MLNYYSLLNIPPTADAGLIDAAFSRFRQRIAEYAPGVEITDSDIQSGFPEVWQAFTILSDPQTRASYDSALLVPVGEPVPEVAEDPEPQTFRTRLSAFFSYAGFILLMVMAVLFLYVLAGYSL